MFSSAWCKLWVLFNLLVLLLLDEGKQEGSSRTQEGARDES